MNYIIFKNSLFFIDWKKKKLRLVRVAMFGVGSERSDMKSDGVGPSREEDNPPHHSMVASNVLNDNCSKTRYL